MYPHIRVNLYKLEEKQQKKSQGLVTEVNFNQFVLQSEKEPLKSPCSASFFCGRSLDVCSVKGLNQGTNTIKQGNSKITIKSNSVTVTGWFMTELTRQRTKGEVYFVFEWESLVEKERRMDKKRERGKKRWICRGTFDLIPLILQHSQNPRLPHLLSFCHVIVISFPTV